MEPINKKVEIAERRVKVAKALIEGSNYREIAAELKVGIGTIARDVKALLAEWRDQRVVDTEAKIGLDEKRLELLIGKFTRKALDEGDARSAEVAIKAMDRKASMLGLNAPSATDVTTRGLPLGMVTLDNISDEDRQAIIKLAHDQLLGAGDKK
jgi:hypothetical protein